MRCIFKLAFSKIEYVGRENIPTDGAIIFAPNHTNGLMDALSVLTIKKGPMVFVARADIFRNKKIAKILAFLKMMPIMRIRDGRENLKKNEEIMQKSVDILKVKIHFCIMPEGTHRAMHSLMPLSKGIFRIALQANENLNSEMPVYIVPVGIEYGDFFRFGASLLINIGKPINISEFVKENNNRELSEMMLQLRSDLHNKIKKQIHYVTDNELHEAIIDASYIRSKNKSSLFETLKERQFQSEILERIDKNSDIINEARHFASLRRKLNIADESLYKNSSITKIIFNSLIIIATTPYFIYSTITSAPIWILAEYLNKKTDDNAMYNTYRFGLMALFLPIIVTISICISASLLKWHLVIASAILTLFSFSFAHFYIKTLRITISNIKIITNTELKTLKSKILSYKY